jgi:hypothetical protein
MRANLCLAALIALFVAGPTAAQQPAPIGDSDPDVVDIAKTPVTDLNIDKEEIPEVLIEAQRAPYDLKGLKSCRKLKEKVEELDAILGPDLDLPQETRDRIAAARIGKAVVKSFIPFRGIIREVSGAKEHQRRIRAAIQAGLARRGFLKGVGEVRRCKYPARPATRENVAELLAKRQAEEEAKAEHKNGKY